MKQPHSRRPPLKGALKNKLPKLVLTRSCIFGDIFGYAGSTGG
jgi:hypothetical protein